MHIAGFDVLMLFEIGKYLAPLGVGLAALWRWGQQFADYFYNREFETWLVSYTYPGPLDPRTGLRTLYLENVGSPERFPDAVRGTRARGLMLAAAKKCSLEGYSRFIVMNREHQELMLHVARNALTKHWTSGVLAKMQGRAVAEQKLYFAVTGSDTAANGKKMFRIPVFTEADARIFLSHPEDKWVFEDAHHAVRLETMQMLAKCLLHEDSKAKSGKNGSAEVVPLIGWIRTWKMA